MLIIYLELYGFKLLFLFNLCTISFKNLKQVYSFK